MLARGSGLLRAPYVPGSWPLQISPGSSTTLANLPAASAEATVEIIAGLPGMPIFTVARTEGAPEAVRYAAVVASNWSVTTC